MFTANAYILWNEDVFTPRLTLVYGYVTATTTWTNNKSVSVVSCVISYFLRWQNEREKKDWIWKALALCGWAHSEILWKHAPLYVSAIQIWHVANLTSFLVMLKWVHTADTLTCCSWSKLGTRNRCSHSWRRHRRSDNPFPLLLFWLDFQGLKFQCITIV